MKKDKKKNRSSVLLILILIVGLSLMLYPSFSNYWNSFHQTRAIANYAETVAGIDDQVYAEMLEDARDYNRRVEERGILWELDEEQIADYERQLDITGTGIMGYIEIQKIDCFLPIYHGTAESVLQIAVGHIEGSSLPVGGEGSHCVLSGHRGLPSARLFADLDRMQEGDSFVLRTLDEILTYQVDQIRIVLPYELDDLRIAEGEDYCTLVTCTPYGVNSHRLLVRGHRIENIPQAKEIRVTGDAFQIDPIVVAPAVAVPMLLLLLLGMLIGGARRKRRRKRSEAEE